MGTITNSTLFIIGLVLLIIGADIFASGSICRENKFKRSGNFMGLIIAHINNSVPALAVCVVAMTKNANDLALSTIIGSCLFNMVFVMGMCALIKPISGLSSNQNRVFLYQIIFTVIFFFFIADCYLPWSPTFTGFSTEHLLEQNIGILDRLESMLILFLFFVFILEAAKTTKKERKSGYLRRPNNISGLASIIYLIGGGFAIIAGSNLVVDNVCDLAKNIGMSQTMTGLTFVGIGVSLPKFARSLSSLKKDENGVILGNLAESNIFNILFILGIVGILQPLMVNMASFIHIGVVIITSLYIYALLLTRRTMGRFEGSTLVLIYILYISYTFMW